MSMRPISFVIIASQQINYLIFESDDNTDVAKDITLRELNAVLQSIKTTD